MPYTLYPKLFTLYPIPYTLYPIPYTLYPMPYTLYPIPYTLYPIPYTLNPIQITGGLNVAADKKIILTGGARADNVVWVVAGASFFTARSHFEGNMLGATAAVFLTGSSIHGRVLVQTAVTL